jgi:hypothetical protein
MKKLIYSILIFCVLVSCKLTDSDTKEVEIVDSHETVVDSLANDKDENGCLASAGYIWSSVNNECVKIYSGIQLNPVDNQQNEDQSKSVFVLFDDSGDKAELFLPSQENSIILTRETEGKPWINKDWQLVPWKGYVLKKGDKNLFSGDGEIGQKVLGSDTEQ